MKYPLTISKRQEGNQLLKLLNSINTEWSEDSVADYSIANKAGVLFLTLTYHRQHPDYIGERIRLFQGSFPLRILLFLVNSEKPDDVIQKLTIFCIHNNINIVLAYDYEEAGRWILCLYNSQENSIDHLKAVNESNHEMAIEALQALGPSKRESELLLDSFPTVADCLLASKEALGQTEIFASSAKVDVFVESAQTPF